MVKFLVLAATAAAALLSGSAHAAAPCVQTNFQQKSADFASLNQIIDLAVGSGMISKFVPSPLTIKDKRLDAIPLSLQGIDFTVTPIIKAVDINGIATVLPRHINVTAPTNLDIGADFNGEVTVNGTIRLEIAQANRKPFSMCYTNVFKPQSCPPANVDMDIDLGLLKPTLLTNALVVMSSCAANAPAGTCTDLNPNDIITAALSGNIGAFLTRVLRRLKDVAITDLKVSFEKLTKLNLQVKSAGALGGEIAKLLGVSRDEVNKKGAVYNGLILATNQLGKTLINKMIKEKLAPQFGNTCYDA